MSPIVVGSLALASLAGCAAMMKSMTPKPRTADNPLVSGQPLEASTKARIGTVTEQDCSIWPFEDSLSVNVTEAQICIVAKKHVEQPPGWSGEPTANRTEFFSVANDANEGGQISVEKVHASKVGSCFERGYQKQIGVWAFEYKGCAPNNGTVSKATKSLRVGDESWELTGAATAAAPPATGGAS
ncbi:MAG TPA: hypothetical protein VFQ53_16850 [Kofleriaceae bacterium]|nr:hypothetical protein [Kofleriaceae bacterium]